MAEENKIKWAEMSHAQKIEFFDKLLNKEILFSLKLLLVQMENLKEMDKKKYTDSIELVIEEFTDRLMILGQQIKKGLLFIIKE